MEEERLFCQTPSHGMVLRHKMSRNAENDSPTPARSSGKGGEGLIAGRSALNPVSLNVGVTGLVPSLESKAGRQLRTVKRALGSFKAKMRSSSMPARRAKGARRHLLDLTVTGTPRTPEGVLRLLGSPLPLPADGTPQNARHYRDPARATPLPASPATPLDGLRRSERLAGRTPTPARVYLRQMPRRLESPGNFVSELNQMTSQLQALTQGVMALEAMETGLAKSIERQESNSSLGAKKETHNEAPAEGAAKKELRGKRTASLTSLRGSLQKRLKKQPSGAELGKDSEAGAKTKETKSKSTATAKESKAKPLKK